jgi:hypothetical protein
MRRVTRWLSLTALIAIALVTFDACASGAPTRPGISGKPLPTSAAPSSGSGASGSGASGSGSSSGSSSSGSSSSGSSSSSSSGG